LTVVEYSATRTAREEVLALAVLPAPELAEAGLAVEAVGVLELEVVAVAALGAAAFVCLATGVTAEALERDALLERAAVCMQVLL